MKTNIGLIIIMLGICSISMGMPMSVSSENEEVIIMYNKAGHNETKNISSMNEDEINDLPIGIFKKLLSLAKKTLNCPRANNIDDEQEIKRPKEEVVLKTVKTPSSMAKKNLEVLDQQIKQYEESFLGSGLSFNTINNGYTSLKKKKGSDFFERFDDTLRALYDMAQDQHVCIDLAVLYKEKANISEEPGDYMKAAFWFRMLHATGGHSSNLVECEDMLSKAGLL